MPASNVIIYQIGKYLTDAENGEQQNLDSMSFSLIGFLEWIASTWGEVVLFGPFSLFEAVAVLYTPCMLCGV